MLVQLCNDDILVDLYDGLSVLKLNAGADGDECCSARASDGQVCLCALHDARSGCMTGKGEA